MPVLIVVALVALVLAVFAVLRMEPARLATLLRPLASFWWTVRKAARPRHVPMPERRREPLLEEPRRKSSSGLSTVRTAVLEMELDHDTGALEGLVLAGRHEQRMLGKMSLRELNELLEDMRGDGESRQLLEAYLDGRFPVWRKHANANRRDGQGVSPGPGPMTKQEAYQVLGLEPGASPADIRKAHRRLIERLQPDVGAPSFLAARINEAKNVLLTNHD